MRKVLFILLPILLCFVVGFTAGQFQQEAIREWYPLLNKPSLTPPNLVFPIAWSFIYLSIGASIGIVLLSASKKKEELTILFGIQLFLNFSWSILFFYLRNPLLGLIDIILLDIFVAAYVVRSYANHKVSSVLFWPYLLWIGFATYLNGYILLHN